MLTASKLTKTFNLDAKQAKVSGVKTIAAVKDVSLGCQAGEVLALLGTNGAGKTTTLRMLSTAMSPDSGEIWLDDIPVHQTPRRARQRIGFLSNATPLYRRLTVKENLGFFGQLYGLSAAALKQRIEQLAEELDFGSYLNKKVDDLSTGMNQKASLARSILHDPDLLMLDEPTTGLDVQAANTILQFIQLQKQLGKAVIFSTHHLHEVEYLADRICLIKGGQARFTGTAQALFQDTQSTNLTDAFLTVIEEKVA